MSSTPSATHPGKAQPARRQQSPKDATAVLREAFDDIALVIGGAAVLQGEPIEQFAGNSASACACLRN